MTPTVEKEKNLRERILGVLPAGTYAMHRFLDLVDVRVDEVCPTACVETGPQPRLHLNAAFVETHCQADEHLFLLVLHELRHLIMGHTQLFSRTGDAENIAFDALINAALCHELPKPEYVCFFESLNGTGTTAQRLLRPPENWCELRNLTDDRKVTPRLMPELYGGCSMSVKEKRLLFRLYFKDPAKVSFQEIVDLLRSQKTPLELPCLLGDHGAAFGEGGNVADSASRGWQGDEDADALRDGIVKQILRDIADRMKTSGKLAGLGGNACNFLIPEAVDPRRQFLVALRQFLMKAAIFNVHNAGGFAYRIVNQAIEFNTPVPEWRDRHACAKEILLESPPLMFQSSVQRNRRRWERSSQAHVYLDISGSMGRDLPWLAAALDPLEKQGKCRIFVFSTVVDTVRRGMLLTGKHKNTYGTDIDCVLRHVLELPRHLAPSRVVVLTDGYTRCPEDRLAREFQKRRMKLYVGLVGHSSGTYLERYATLMTTLPEPR